MINTKLSSLFNSLNTRKKEVPQHVPKFQVGDWAHNKWQGANTIIEIVKVIVYSKEDRELTNTYIGAVHSVGHYELRTVHGDKKTSKYLYTRTKSIQAIDAYYTKMDKKTARILYGIE